MARDTANNTFPEEKLSPIHLEKVDSVHEETQIDAELDRAITRKCVNFHYTLEYPQSFHIRFRISREH